MRIHTTRGNYWLHEEWGIQWDGEPKMGGGFHVMSVGTTWRTEQEAQSAAKKALMQRKPNLRIVYRITSDWEPIHPESF